MASTSSSSSISLRSVEPTICNRKVPGSSPSLCTFVRVRFGRYYNPSPDPAQCGKPTALGTPVGMSKSLLNSRPALLGAHRCFSSVQEKSEVIFSNYFYLFLPAILYRGDWSSCSENPKRNKCSPVEGRTSKTPTL